MALHEGVHIQFDTAILKKKNKKKNASYNY